MPAVKAVLKISGFSRCGKRDTSDEKSLWVLPGTPQPRTA